jgi:hypothetical protein
MSASRYIGPKALRLVYIFYVMPRTSQNSFLRDQFRNSGTKLKM